MNHLLLLRAQAQLRLKGKEILSNRANADLFISASVGIPLERRPSFKKLMEEKEPEGFQEAMMYTVRGYGGFAEYIIVYYDKQIVKRYRWAHESVPLGPSVGKQRLFE